MSRLAMVQESCHLICQVAAPCSDAWDAVLVLIEFRMWIQDHFSTFVNITILDFHQTCWDNWHWQQSVRSLSGIWISPDIRWIHFLNLHRKSGKFWKTGCPLIGCGKKPTNWGTRAEAVLVRLPLKEMLVHCVLCYWHVLVLLSGKYIYNARFGHVYLASMLQ